MFTRLPIALVRVARLIEKPRQHVHFLCTMRADSPAFEFGGQPRHPETELQALHNTQDPKSEGITSFVGTYARTYTHTN